MNGIIKVNPEQLIAMANEFSAEASSIQMLTNQMMNLIHGTYSIWSGEAANAYVNKFNGLQGDMDQMFRMIREHSDDLQTMAANYKMSETQNTSDAMALISDVIV